MPHSEISIHGARVHNLKDIDITIPKNKLVVVTGLSGSGKSSLAFDTIYAEGQRQYVDSLSSYARQFIGIMDKPDVDQITGLSPVIAIDQKSTAHNPRSTVGTITEIYDYLRLLYARIGIAHCPETGKEMHKMSIAEIIEQILKMPKQTRISVMAPVLVQKKGKLDSFFKKLEKGNFQQVRFDGEIVAIKDLKKQYIDEEQPHDLDLVIDHLFTEPIRKDKLQSSPLFLAIKQALDLSNGLVKIVRKDNGEELLFSQHLYCPESGISLPEFDLASFSFNSPKGACPTCTGLGVILEVEPEVVVFNPRLTIEEGAVKIWTRLTVNQPLQQKILSALAKTHKIPLNKPVNKLTKKQLDVLLYGAGAEEEYEVNGKKYTFPGIISFLEQKYKETDSDYIKKEIEEYMRERECPECAGRRLKQESLLVTVAEKSIADIVSMDLEELQVFFEAMAQDVEGKTPKLLREKDVNVAKPIIKEIQKRIGYLIDVSLHYLTLNRSGNTLSGGELQRIRLAKQISSSLTGIIYVLDEPSIGLHQRDNDRLIATLKKLRDMGNTVIVVEHDEDIMREADLIIDIGPGAGEYGGQIVGQGTLAEIKKNKDSLTGAYLSGKQQISTPKKYRKGNGKQLTIKGASAFNLKNVDVKIPLAKFVCVSGVSGSGKSTLITEILSKALAQHFYRAKAAPASHKEITGLSNLDKVITVDQSPIGRTPRSNPATYTGVFTYIRDLFTQVPEAKLRGFDAGKFSFNVVDGRCETCNGDGFVKIEMQFLPDVYVECEDCHGKRYKPEVLEIHYKDKNIADVLEMDVEEARRFFEDVPIIADKLKTLSEVGLGYIKLGQPATTLSGGEAQRVKLSTELSRRSTGKTLYILDEPTTGLHFDDINRLLGVLQKLVDKGNTVLIIEHNIDVIKAADWIIDMGPDGGDKGGEIVAEGTPKEVAKVKDSFTGQYLKETLKSK